MDIAFSLLGPILVGAYFGHKLDAGNKFPIWTISFVFLGMITGFWSVYKRYMD